MLSFFYSFGFTINRHVVMGKDYLGLVFCNICSVVPFPFFFALLSSFGIMPLVSAVIRLLCF